MTQQTHTGHTGPYIVTTKRHLGSAPAFGQYGAEFGSRCAVPNLQEAREQVDAILTAHPTLDPNRGHAEYERLIHWAYEELPEEGGSITLSDGTVIEVARGAGQQEMRQHLREWGVSMDTRDALDDTIVFAWVTAYNAAQAEGLMT